MSVIFLDGASYKSKLRDDVTRPFVGKEFWPNPQMDWQLKNGRMEVMISKVGKTHDIHLLTHQLKSEEGSFSQSVQLSFKDVNPKKIKRAGFKFGVVGAMPEEYRSNLFQSTGYLVGVTSDGKLFGPGIESKTNLPKSVLDDLQLNLKVEHKGGSFDFILEARKRSSENKSSALLFINKAIRLKKGLMGNLCLFADYAQKNHAPAIPADIKEFQANVTFQDWQISGNKVKENLDQTFGPVLWTQYTLHRGVMKMTAQVSPMGRMNREKVHLELLKEGKWKRIQSSAIHEYASTAHFRMENWNDQQPVSFRVVLKDGNEMGEWKGTIRKDPKNKKTIKLAALSCMKDGAFPNQYLQQNILAQNPDILFFAGDQLYESNGGYGIVRAYKLADVSRASLNYLQKYWIFGWSFREAMKDRPSVVIPDDHDVYHGNIWGLGGGPVPEGGSRGSDGGYEMHPEWVRMVERTQVYNLPDPYDPTPVLQDIGVYYTDFNYGGISMAVIEDRKFKSGPAQAVDKKTHKGRVDHVRDPNLDPMVLDKPGLHLLGDRQEKFLEEWAGDFRDASMKAILSQSPFCAVATHHGGGKDSNLLIADLDSNGWPQSGRNRAIELARKAHAVMIHGDQHLATVVHHGIDQWNDAGFSFAGAGIFNGYPRLWAPKQAGKNRRVGSPKYTGEFLDGFHNKINVWAAANRMDKQYPERIKDGPQTMLDKLNNTASGYGIVKFHKDEQEISMESWPIYDNMNTDISKYDTHAGWPVTVSVDQQYNRKPLGYLAPIKMKRKSFIVRVRKEPSGELVYARRITKGIFLPKVFETGNYRVEVGEPGNWKTFKNQKIQN
ncbi:MAG: alkaline phosphatase D family protein [Verrucomicrobiota bacterium]|nr:alkaline phosphatase D family protein [Verrucomicrobiota bacterium]